MNELYNYIIFDRNKYIRRDNDASYYILDVREADTNLENIDLEGYILSKYIEYVKSLPNDVNIMIADSHW